MAAGGMKVMMVVALFGADGSWGYKDSDGNSTYFGADGSWGYKRPDGTSSYFGADGSTGYGDSEGNSSYYEADDTSSDDKKAKISEEAISAGVAAGIGLASFAKVASYKSQNNYSHSFDEPMLKTKSYAYGKGSPGLLERIVSRIIRFFLKLFAVLFCICFLSAIISIGVYLYIKSKPISPAISSSECIGMDKDEVVEIFEDAGFEYVFDDELEDLDLIDISKENTVGKVSIDKITSFSSTDEFSYDDRVYVYYHSLKKIKPPITYEDVKDNNYQDVEKLFRASGFENITFKTKEDLILGLLTKDGAVESVSIDGNSKYIDADIYRLDANIEIVYHTFPKKS